MQDEEKGDELLQESSSSSAASAKSKYGSVRIAFFIDNSLLVLVLLSVLIDELSFPRYGKQTIVIRNNPLFSCDPSVVRFTNYEIGKTYTQNGNFLLICMCNFHVLSHLLLIYICKLHWNSVFAKRFSGVETVQMRPPYLGRVLLVFDPLSSKLQVWFHRAWNR
jgi:hypothetical protein